MNDRDATGATPKSEMTSRLMTSLDLVDVWREIHRNQTNFTFIRGGSGSRLDRFLVSKSTRGHLRTIQHAVTCFSDHKAVIVRMVMPVAGTNIGRGIWRLNAVSMDDEDTMAELQRKWDYLVRQRRNYTSWLKWWIDFAKPKLAAFFKWRTSIQNREYRDTMELLYGELARRYDLYVNDASQLTGINHIKSIMLRMQREKSNKSRLLYDTYLQGEPTSTFHLAEKTQNRKSTYIHQLEVDGTIIQGPEVVQHAVEYFENLFSDNTADLQSPDFVPTRRIPQHNERNEAVLDPVSDEEILKCIKQSCSRKSPGEDGLPKEFYAKAWDIIKEEFTLTINEALLAPDTSSKLMNGIVVLVKKKSTGNDMKAYRPITLLNFDYKVLTRIIKQRIAPLVDTVLSSHQKCSNGKHNIFEATTKILDKISALKFGGQPSMLVSFDMDHAFDRVKHSFLFRVMEQMNFNPRLIEFLQKITRNSFSRILVNGNLSRSFQIRRSVRQGDPLSMLLFVLYIQPLIDKIVSEGHAGDALNIYADDLSVFVPDGRRLTHLVNMIQAYEPVSGAVLNLAKTVALKIGNVETSGIPTWLKFEDSCKILGLIFTDTVKKTMELTWNKILKQLKWRLWMCKSRVLNLIQKVIHEISWWIKPSFTWPQINCSHHQQDAEK